MTKYYSGKSRRMRWTGHVARLGERRDAYRILVEKPDRKKPLGRPGVNGSIILKRIFKKRGGGASTGLICVRIGTGGGLL
jgi:hypothetical protein